MPLLASAKRFNAILTVGDRIVFAFLLILSLSSYFWVNSLLEPGSIAMVANKTKPPFPVSLQRASILRVDGFNGEVEIEIARGQIRIIKAICPHQVCVRQGWISRVGEVLVCVPNGVSIWIEGKTAHQIDAFTG